jgi:hypothetical protein
MMDGIECAAVNADFSQSKKLRKRFVLLPLPVIEFSVQNMKRDLPGQLILVDRPLRRAMRVEAPKAHYFNIEQGTARSTSTKGKHER